MDSIASYEELDLDQEDFCVHIMNNALLDLYVEDTSKWYCTQCKRPFADKEDMEQHSLANLGHDCYYNVDCDCFVCTACKKKILAFAERMCEDTNIYSDCDSQSENSDNDHSTHDHSENENSSSSSSSTSYDIRNRMYPLNSYVPYTGPTIDLNELIDGLRANRFHNILVIAGAGISCASGIPDFRSANGLYRNLSKFPVPYLRDPSTIFNIRDFYKYSVPFWILAKEMFYTSNLYHPTPCHFFLHLLAQKGILRRVYTQNIDGLERKAGLEPPLLIEGHGTCARGACRYCMSEFDINTLQKAANSRQIPLCPKCGSDIKPSIVFFGEDLPNSFYDALREDRFNVDLLIVMGTSLQVHPMCDIPYRIAPETPRVLINNQQVGAFNDPRLNNFTLLGDCQNLVLSIIEMCGWKNQYEEMIEQYCTENHADHFLWEDQYNFDQIESNFEIFERELLEGSFAKEEKDDRIIESDNDEEYDDDNNVNNDENSTEERTLFSIFKQAGVHHIEEDDGRELPKYCDDEEKVERATEFFVLQILNNRIKNSFRDDVENGEENVILSFNGILLTLNHVNSRCFREILKWNRVKVPIEDCL